MLDDWRIFGNIVINNCGLHFSFRTAQFLFISEIWKDISWLWNFFKTSHIYFEILWWIYDLSSFLLQKRLLSESPFSNTLGPRRRCFQRRWCHLEKLLVLWVPRLAFTSHRPKNNTKLEDSPPQKTQVRYHTKQWEEDMSVPVLCLAVLVS